MHISAPVAIAIQLAALIPYVSAHCKIMAIWGDAEPGRQPAAFAYDGSLPIGGTGLWPYQYDVTVFSSPIIPNPAVPRVWLPQGCGATLQTLEAYYSVARADVFPGAQVAQKYEWWHKNYIPNDLRAYINQIEETKKVCAANRLPRVTRGGNLNWKVYTVNEDGAGPFRCRIDTTGTGAQFGAWLPMNDKLQVPPLDTSKYSVLYSQVGQLGYIGVTIPSDLTCTGSYPGYDNVCMMRCENYAQNGPFGACMAFQLRGPGNTDFGEKKVVEKPVEKVIVSKGYTETVTRMGTKTVTVQPKQYDVDKHKVAVPSKTGNPGYDIAGGKSEYYKRAAKMARRAALQARNEAPGEGDEQEEDQDAPKETDAP
ncbi:hypothetical protein Dda_7459 [Drechslerella dactyloides]|uniref:Uncharacterized protein n=1 Tax=Drechslerella dactyloides TaxID=74499 RepID=A0AAD6IVR0_DREDA|nr:hypothetical protein Dda_7459 [Drechslerella dactyloides]